MSVRLWLPRRLLVTVVPLALVAACTPDWPAYLPDAAAPDSTVDAWRDVGSTDAPPREAGRGDSGGDGDAGASGDGDVGVGGDGDVGVGGDGDVGVGDGGDVGVGDGDVGVGGDGGGDLGGDVLLVEVGPSDSIDDTSPADTGGADTSSGLADAGVGDAGPADAQGDGSGG